MWLKALNTRKAAEVGASLADRFVTTAAPPAHKEPANSPNKSRQLQAFLATVDREAAPLQLGLIRRAKLANSFKWRLLDNGVEPGMVDQLTRMLLMRLTNGSADAGPLAHQAASSDLVEVATPASTAGANNLRALLAAADACGARGANAEAAELYQKAVKLKPRHLLARNNLGVALLKLGRYPEAAEHFRRATGIQSTYVDAQYNLGLVLRLTGRVYESEMPLRRALKLNPRHIDAQVSLGLTLAMMSRLRDARECFEKALKLSPRHGGALHGMGQVASLEGRFGEAESFFKKAVVFDSQAPAAWASLAGLRKMTTADASWLKSVEKLAASGLAPMEEADLRFAIGKYFDDVGSFEQAFQSYSRGNELLKSGAEEYDPEARSEFVDSMIRVYTREGFAETAEQACESARPVMVTGMMRSGTSLVEQIVASHPAAAGAGELPFWNDAARKYGDAMRNRWLSAALRRKLADSYLATLNTCSTDALRVVDKSTFNTDHLGLIHSVFPHARMIYVRRDPIDTCLSCYFHQFSTAHNFTLDLGDLTHYYREHQRLLAHWRATLPQGTLLEVPYAELVTDQEKWTRRIVEFIGLEWDERCLDFHQTQRPVMTASFWQVRQRIYKSSVGRWRNYQKFLGPLRELEES